MRWDKAVSVLASVAVPVFALCSAASASDLSITVNSTEIAPVIDGVLEGTWNQADSAYTFIQRQPYEGELLSEPTVAYFLQDDKALYVAFSCRTGTRKPDCVSSSRESRAGDLVIVYFDTFLDKRNAYQFTVNCAGVPGDAMISANGAEENSSWDGVFSSAAQVDSAGFVVEVAIPWSTFRFGKNLTTWGVNLERRIPVNEEVGYFAPVFQDESFTVSNFARLVGVRPKRPSRGIEFFPRGFYRTERSYGEKSHDFKPAADVNWAITPQIRLQSTFNPDFSQVEADPYAINLSKYALYFDEKRPFFTEGQEYFAPSGSVMADQFELFYSRQIGKKLPDGSEVPLDAGGRIIGKAGRLEFGSLICGTDNRVYDGWIGPTEEPSAVYLVNRINYQPFTNTTVGMLYAGKHSDGSRNDVVSVDGSTMTRTLEFTYQLANSYHDGVSDWAGNAYVSWIWSRKYVVRANAQVIGDRFDVSEIGYVPWNGYRGYSFSAGRVFFPKSGPIKYGAVRAFGVFKRELNEEQFSRVFSLALEASFRNGWGVSVTRGLGHEYESGDRYNPKSFSARVSTDQSRRFRATTSFYTSYGYNYQRGFFARSETISLYTSLRVCSEFSVSMSGNSWIEHAPDGSVFETTYRLRPSLYFSPTPGVSLSVYQETPIIDGEGVVSTLVGISFRYNFLPKSWVYVAFNDYQWRREDNGVFDPLERVFAVKIKHLIAW